jgi:hypothetical protein
MPEKLTDERYEECDWETRALLRCFLPIEALPPKALEDCRSLAIQGASLARGILSGTSADESDRAQARRFIELYERP